MPWILPLGGNTIKGTSPESETPSCPSRPVAPRRAVEHRDTGCKTDWKDPSERPCRDRAPSFQRPNTGQSA